MFTRKEKASAALERDLQEAAARQEAADRQEAARRAKIEALEEVQARRHELAERLRDRLGNHTIAITLRADEARTVIEELERQI
jgi:dTDP-4-amino-4,6-dideoxygalactose transaminase